MATINDIKQKYQCDTLGNSELKRITFLKAAIESNNRVIEKAKKDISEATKANVRLKKELKGLEK